MASAALLRMASKEGRSPPSFSEACLGVGVGSGLGVGSGIGVAGFGVAARFGGEGEGWSRLV